MTLGEKIYKLRTEKGISQETMANDLYVSRQAVSKWETDSSVPDLDKIKLLADYFEISIDELVSENVVNNTKEINSEKYDVNKIKRMTSGNYTEVILFYDNSFRKASKIFFSSREIFTCVKPKTRAVFCCEYSFKYRSTTILRHNGGSVEIA